MGFHFCTDASRAAELNKPVIPVKLEAGYEPDGWLADLCHDRQVYDLSDPQTFDNEFNKLHARLKELHLPINDNNAGLI